MNKIKRITREKFCEYLDIKEKFEIIFKDKNRYCDPTLNSMIKGTCLGCNYKIKHCI